MLIIWLCMLILFISTNIYSFQELCKVKKKKSELNNKKISIHPKVIVHISHGIHKMVKGITSQKILNLSL